MYTHATKKGGVPACAATIVSQPVQLQLLVVELNCKSREPDSTVVECNRKPCADASKTNPTAGIQQLVVLSSLACIPS